MSRNGSGTYTLPAGNPVVTSTTIASTWANNTMTDLATALTGSLASDGQTTATGNLKMGNNRITGLANGIASTDAASITQVTTAVAITGGAIDGTTVGTTTRSTVKAITLDLGLSTQSVAIGQGNASIMKNRIINGAMVIDQRNAGASVTPTANTYTLDRWLAVAASAASKFSVQQNAGSVTPPVGFTNYLGVTSLSAYSVSASDFLCMLQNIEGYNVGDLSWGTANAKTVTLSFWVRSSLTGTFGGALSNSAGDRSYPFTYTISVANTWEQKSITVAGDTSGTWLTTNGIGVSVRIGLGVGSTYNGTAGAWSANNYFSATGATSVVGTNGATFYITGVQLEVGSSATGFEYRLYNQELAACYRYFQSISYTTNTMIASGVCDSLTSCQSTISLLQTMRAIPTITLPLAGQTSGKISFLASGGTYPASTGTNTVNSPSVNNFVISGESYSASFVQGNAAWLYPTGNVVITASAEL
jgi:hypothetical protein